MVRWHTLLVPTFCFFFLSAERPGLEGVSLAQHTISSLSDFGVADLHSSDAYRSTHDRNGRTPLALRYRHPLPLSGVAGLLSSARFLREILLSSKTTGLTFTLFLESLVQILSYTLHESKTK